PGPAAAKPAEEKKKPLNPEPPRPVPRVKEPRAEAPRVAPQRATAPAAAPAAETAVKPVAAPAAESAIALDRLQPGDWITLFEALELSGVTRSMAAHAVLEAVKGESLHLVLDERNATLFNDEHRKGIEQALAKHFGTELRLQMRVAAVEGETPAAWRRRRESEQREAAQ